MTLLTKSKIEYLDYGINWRRGCRHDCDYCYMAALAQRFEQLRPLNGWAHPELRVLDPGETLRTELGARTAKPDGILMLSTSHDPAMDVRCARELRQIVEVLGEFGLLSQTLLLTKAPRRALTVLDGLGAKDGLRFGVSYTSISDTSVSIWEPGAEMSRLIGLRLAVMAGYETWVSIEPPLPGALLSALVYQVLKYPALHDSWVVLGKMNYRGTDEVLSTWSKADLWPHERDRAVAMLEAHNFRQSLKPVDGGYWVKNELQEA